MRFIGYVAIVMVATLSAVAHAQGQSPTVSVAIQSPGNGAVVQSAATIPLTATASVNRNNWPVLRVEYYDGTRLMGSATTPPYAVQWVNASPGTYRVSAKAIATNPGQGRQATPTPNMPTWTGESASITIRVNAPPTIALTAPTPNVVLQPGGSATVTANAADADGTVARVDFYVNGGLVGSRPQAPYSMTWMAASAGTYAFTAVATDNDGASTSAGPVSLRVNAVPTVTITSPASSSVVASGGALTIAASAQDADGNISRVEFYQGTTLVGTATAAPYTATLANLTPGAYTYTARAYDNDGGAAMSSAIAVRVNGPPTVAITSPAASATFARGATVSLTANASDADGTVSKVEFYANGALLGAATTSPFTYAWTASSSGAYTLTAVATDNDGATTTSAAVAIRVNAVPQVTITAPAQNTVTNAPGSLTVSATASDADGTVTKVEFYANGSLIGGATQAPYSITWSNVPAGRYSLTAIATDNDGGTATSAAVSVRVNGYPTVMLTSPTPSASFRAPATVTFTATAQDTDGAINRVEFYAGTTLVATITAAPYTYTWTNVAAGSYSLTARAVDDAGAGTVSAPVAITIASAEAQIYYIHTDHLNTPRMITDAQREVVWTWMNDDPFGANPANEDPRNTGSSFTCNLRFPGQYFDRETNTHYNYFRDYDPGIGRYIEFDPIGLRGGINGYAYVSSNPLGQFDPTGLAAWLCLRSTSFGIGNHTYFYDDKTKQCCGDPGPGGKNPLQSCREKGPSGDSCVLISSNDDEAQKLLKCCNDRTNKSFYFPGINDCQNLADDCIRQLQMAPTATSGFNRWRPCPSCWRQ